MGTPGNPAALASGVSPLKATVEVLARGVHDGSLRGRSLYTLFRGRLDLAWIALISVRPVVRITTLAGNQSLQTFSRNQGTVDPMGRWTFYKKINEIRR